MAAADQARLPVLLLLVLRPQVCSEARWRT